MEEIIFDSDTGRAFVTSSIREEYQEEAELHRLHILETVAESDEELMEKYLTEGQPQHRRPEGWDPQTHS